MNTDKQVPTAQPDADIARTAQSVLKWTALLGPYGLSERELVRTTAWAMPGVRNVVDNMTVAF
jgi:hypothetical protein